MPLDLSEVVNDPDLGTDVKVLRSRGQFVLGGWEEKTIPLPAYGVLVPADDKALKQVPEGDRVVGSIQFLTATQLYQTHGGQQAGLSDKVEWRGEVYRVQVCNPWIENGFYSAILVRIAGN